jgi:hypothetical protein
MNEMKGAHMQQNGYIPDTANAIAQYFNKASLPSQQETLGQIVMDILNEGRHLNRKALCTKLLSRLDRARAGGREPLSDLNWSAVCRRITSSIVACCSAVADEGRSLPQTCC